MNDTPHPFLFNPAMAADAEKDLELRMSALQVRIDKLVNAVEISGMPIVQHLLSLTHDRAQLEFLSEVLGRLAPLVEMMDEYQSQRQVFKFARTKPNWFASVFGDYTSDVEDAVQQFGADSDE